MTISGSNLVERYHRRKRKAAGNASPKQDDKQQQSTLSQHKFLLFVIATLFIRAESFQSHPITRFTTQQRQLRTSTNYRNFHDRPQAFGNHHHPSRGTFVNNQSFLTRSLETRIKASPETEQETIATSSDSSDSSSLSNLEDDSNVVSLVEDNDANATSVSESLQYSDKINHNDITQTDPQEEDWIVTRRDAFRYGTILTGAVWATFVTFTQTDPSTKPKPKVVAPTPDVTPGFIEPVNLTKVVSQTNVNVTVNCDKMCVSIDSDNFAFNKVEQRKTPDWWPSILKPKSQIVKKIPNSELLVAATAAGAVVEMARTSLLYPLQTVKARMQADRNENLNPVAAAASPSLSEQLENFGENIREKIDDGDLYAGISPTLLVSVPATGIYYGVRDVTKRLLFLTSLDPTWIAVGGALVGDVVSLCFRVPGDALAIRLQTQSSTTNNNSTDSNSTTADSMGDWLGDSIQRVPMVILTDLPYLLSKIVLNKQLIQGDMSVSQYAVAAVLAAIVAGFLTTPFDVARTRILLDKWSVENDEEGAEEETSNNNPGNSVLKTMIAISKEGDGGYRNLFAGWLERVLYLGIGRAWLEPIQLIGYIGIRDAVLLEWF